MECRKRKRKGSRKSGVKVRGVARGRKCRGREMEWRKHVGTEAEWRKLEKWFGRHNKSSEGKRKCGREEKKSQNGKEKKQRLNW